MPLSPPCIHRSLNTYMTPVLSARLSIASSAHQHTKSERIRTFFNVCDLKYPLSIDMRKCIEGFILNKLGILFPWPLMCIRCTANGL